MSCSFFFSDSSILPEEMASQSVRLKEEQLRREEEKVGHYDDAIIIVAHDVFCPVARN